MQRVGDTLSGAAKSYGASVVNTLGTVYATQKDSFTKDMEQQNADSYSRQNQRFQQEYQEMLAENEKNPGTWSQQILDNQRRKIEKTGTLSQNLSGLARSDYRPKAAQQVYGLADQLQADANKDIQRAKEGLGALGQFAVDVGVGAVQLAGDMAVGAATGGGAAIPAAVRSFGGKAQEARQEGATLDKQVAAGVTSGLTGLVTEKISSVGNIQTKAFGSGALDDIMAGVVAAVEKTGKTKAGRAALNRLATAGVGAFGEGLEEGLESVIDQTVTSRIYSDKPIDWKQVAADAAYSALVGGAIGGITGGIGGTNTSVRNSGAETQRESAEPGNRPSVDKAIPTAYNEPTSEKSTPEQSVARIAGQIVPTERTAAPTSGNNTTTTGKIPETTGQRGSADNSVSYETFVRGYRQKVNPRASDETIRKSYDDFSREIQTVQIGDRTVTRPQFRQVFRGLTDEQLNEFFDFVRGQVTSPDSKKMTVRSGTETVFLDNSEKTEHQRLVEREHDELFEFIQRRNRDSGPMVTLIDGGKWDGKVGETERSDQGGTDSADARKSEFVAEATARGQAVRAFEGVRGSSGEGRPRLGRFTLISEPQETAAQTVVELERLGVPAFVHGGDLEILTLGGSVIRSGTDATMVNKSAVGISNNIDIPPRETAGHEAYHFMQGDSKREKYSAVITANIDVGSEAFEELVNEIEANYFEDGFDSGDSKQEKKFYEELHAYASGYIHNNSVPEGLFINKDEVCQAWEKLVLARKNNGNKL